MGHDTIRSRGGRAVLLPPEVVERVDALATELGLHRASGRGAGGPDRVALISALVGEVEGGLSLARTRLASMGPGDPPRVYVACASADIEDAEAAIARLSELGCSITYDWTLDVRAMGSAPADPAVARRAVEKDIEGVASAECLLLVDGASSYGRTVELGAGIMRALHDGMPIVQWGTGGDLTRGRIWETVVTERHVHLGDACESARELAMVWRSGGLRSPQA